MNSINYCLLGMSWFCCTQDSQLIGFPQSLALWIHQPTSCLQSFCWKICWLRYWGSLVCAFLLLSKSSLCLISKQFAYNVSWCQFLWVHPLGFLELLAYLHLVFFINFRKFLAIISSSILSSPGIPTMCILVLSHRCLKLCSFFIIVLILSVSQIS